MDLRDSTTRTRAFQIALGVLISSAVVGFFLEVNRKPPGTLGYADGVEGSAGGERVRSYSELRNGSGPHTDLYRGAAHLLHEQLPSRTDAVTRNPGDRERALAARAEHRAFDGAPPTIPHPIEPRTIPNCTVCHERGAKIGERIAPAMSHRPYASCTQCHVPAAGFLASDHGADEASPVPHLAEGNEFAPLPFGGLGTRAFPGAPPTVPHTLAMRDRCESCHGVSGHAGVRTTHPERQNCRQCHAHDATLHPTLASVETTPRGKP